MGPYWGLIGDVFVDLGMVLGMVFRSGEGFGDVFEVWGWFLGWLFDLGMVLGMVLGVGLGGPRDLLVDR